MTSKMAFYIWDPSTLWGSGGNDHLYGSAGTDLLLGGEGDDHLHGGSGLNYLYGGEDNDTYYIGDGLSYNNLAGLFSIKGLPCIAGGLLSSDICNLFDNRRMR